MLLQGERDDDLVVNTLCSKQWKTLNQTTPQNKPLQTHLFPPEIRDALLQYEKAVLIRLPSHPYSTSNILIYYLLLLFSYVFFLLRVQEHYVVESKPDNPMDDLRLHKPWTQLKEWGNGKHKKNIVIIIIIITTFFLGPARNKEEKPEERVHTICKTFPFPYLKASETYFLFVIMTNHTL